MSLEKRFIIIHGEGDEAKQSIEQNRTPDLFEEFKSMSMSELGGYAQVFNIFIKDPSGREGILISYMDMEKSSKKLNILVDGDMEYWDETTCTFDRAENRKWETLED